jgi:hypothetical protein
MHIQNWKKLIMLSVLGMLTTVSAHAQAGKRFVVTIPFSFDVGAKTLPAGQYFVGRATEASDEGVVLRGTDGRAGVFVLTRVIQTLEVQHQSKLIFRRYGDQYFLAEVWNIDKSTGRGLPTSRKERSLAQEIAKHGAKPEKVAIVGDKR